MKSDVPAAFISEHKLFCIGTTQTTQRIGFKHINGQTNGEEISSHENYAVINLIFSVTLAVSAVVAL